jgi:hypothetical protein
MKKENKISYGKIKPIHNKKLLIVIIVFILILGIILFSISRNNPINPSQPTVIECSVDSDCVPDSCCHAFKCVSIDRKPDCKNKLCTADCESLLDCGMGKCSCIENKCMVVKLKN